jgi:hypothetical protein
MILGHPKLRIQTTINLPLGPICFVSLKGLMGGMTLQYWRTVLGKKNFKIILTKFKNIYYSSKSNNSKSIGQTNVISYVMENTLLRCKKKII